MHVTLFAIFQTFGIDLSILFFERVWKTQNNISFSFQKNVEVHIEYEFDVGANLPPVSSEKSIELPRNFELERHQQIIYFGIDFCAMWTPAWVHFEATLGSSWPPKSLRGHPKRFPRRAWEPESAQTPKMHPKCGPSSPK